MQDYRRVPCLDGLMHEANRVQINYFVSGDSTDVTTWSGFPFYLGKALEEKGVTLNRINMFPDPWVYNFYSRGFGYWGRFKKRWLNQTANRNFYQSDALAFFSALKIRAACSKFRNADCNLFLSYSLSSHAFSQIPTTHFCDQTYGQAFARIGDPLTHRQQQIVHQQRVLLSKSRAVFATMPATVNHLRDEWKLGNVYPKFLTGINLDVVRPPVSESLACKRASNVILFIGRGVWGRGADILVEAFRPFNARHQHHFVLHMVGVDETDFSTPVNERFIVFHKYLRKNNVAEWETYLSLLMSARAFVFPARSEMLAFAMLEALYMGTPVIATDVPGVRDLVQDRQNGLVLGTRTPEAVAAALDELIDNPAWWEKAVQGAYASAERFSWTRVADELVGVMAQFQ
jgi:glycosyltransferase involved in cell wall biosynthesis